MVLLLCQMTMQIRVVRLWHEWKETEASRNGKPVDGSALSCLKVRHESSTLLECLEKSKHTKQHTNKMQFKVAINTLKKPTD